MLTHLKKATENLELRNSGETFPKFRGYAQVHVIPNAVRDPSIHSKPSHTEKTTHRDCLGGSSLRSE